MLRRFMCTLVLASASARLALSVASHTTLVVTPERVYESAAATIDASDLAQCTPSGTNSSWIMKNGGTYNCATDYFADPPAYGCAPNAAPLKSGAQWAGDDGEDMSVL